MTVIKGSKWESGEIVIEWINKKWRFMVSVEEDGSFGWNIVTDQIQDFGEIPEEVMETLVKGIANRNKLPCGHDYSNLAIDFGEKPTSEWIAYCHICYEDRVKE